MKISKTLLVVLFTISPFLTYAQSQGNHGNAEAEFFGLLELPFLITAIVFSFMTAKNMKGGKFGAGMNLLAWGFLVMAIGHIHMQIEHLFDYNLFNNLMGETIGKYAWYAALIVTWALSALGFYRIFKASKV